jgi:hypothetical protein
VSERFPYIDGSSASGKLKVKLGDRLTVRLRPLEPRIGVRIPVSQPLLFPTMRVLAVICAFTLVGLAPARSQPAPPKVPKKVDETLRARVNEFHQHQMAGNFRKAFDFVAKDSQDFFLTIPKDKPTVFKIEEIRYNDRFTRATVKVAATNRILVGSRAVEVPTSAVDYWKLEGGKWMWYHDLDADRPNFFGLKVGDSSKPDDALAQAVPKDTSSLAVTSAAEAALQAAASRPLLDKSSLEFTLGTPGTQEVLVRNNYKGAVRLVISLPDEQTGVTVEPMEVAIEPLGETRIQVHYLALYKEAATTNVTIRLDPFPKRYLLPVQVIPASPAASQDSKP